MNESTELAPRVLVVVVTHNGGDWLGHCLKAIAGQDYPLMSTIVIDSASEASAAHIVRKAMPGAEFVRLEENVGFGAAANHALETSVHAPDADYYLFVHDDVVIQADCIHQLVEAATVTEAGVVGGKGLAWDQPDLLLEVGMSADQLGFPFTGLETGEIDQGQHDIRQEVLFVTNACILISKALIERCGSWDGAYFAFGEDLDLCIRAKLAGSKVVFEPAARFNHVVALANQVRNAQVEPVRFYTRRNRLRTIAKTAAAYRLWAVLSIYFVVITSEMVLLASLRNFEELRTYPKAFRSFLRSIPDVFRRRRAVQKRRAIPDRRIRRFMVSDVHRARVFAERRLREWEVDTIAFGERTISQLRPAALRATFLDWIRKPSSAGISAFVVLFAIATRRVLLGGPLAAGGIWPFPAPIRRLLGDYFAPWRDVGLGTSSAAPPALLLTWLAGAVSLGDAARAQFILMAALATAGLVGMYRLVSRRTSRAGPRIAALAVYGLGPVAHIAFSGADLGALALFAGAPYILVIGLGLVGPTPSEEGHRPPAPSTLDALVQDMMRLALVSAAVVALAPSAYLALVVLWAVVAIYSFAAAWDRREVRIRTGWLARSLAVTAVLLLPWSIEAFRPRGAVLGPIFSGAGGGGTYAALWSRFSFTDFLLLRPGAGALAAIATGAILVSALVLATPARRHESKLLVTMIVSFAAIGGLVAKGFIPAPASSGAMWMIIPAAGLAILVGHLVAGLAEELPRHALGRRQGIAVGAVIVIAVGIVGGWGPGLSGWDRPASTFAAPLGDLPKSLGSFFVSTAKESGDYRILWLGEKWIDPIRSAARRTDTAPYFLTGPRELSMRNLYEPPPSAGELALDRIVESMTTGRLDHAGHLLAPMSIRFLVADTADRSLMSAIQRQGDLKLEQSEIAVFSNLRWVPRATLAPPGLAEAAATVPFDERKLMLSDWGPGEEVPVRSQGSFRGELPPTKYPSILVGDNYSSGWKARAGQTRLAHAEALGWANRFEVPTGSKGRVSIAYSRRWTRILWLTVQAILIGMAVTMARLGPERLTQR